MNINLSKKFHKNIISSCYYLIGPIFILLFMKFYFQISWNIDSSKIFGNRDYFLVSFFIENIVRFGDIYCNNLVGHPHIDVKCFNDYNNDHAWFNYLIIKILANFNSDSKLLLIQYFLVSLVMICLASNFVFIKFGISKYTSIFLSILFALSYNRLIFSYIISVGNYVALPFLYLFCFRIYQQKFSLVKIYNQKISLDLFKKEFLYFLLFAILVNGTSAYYSYFTIMTLLFMPLISYAKTHKRDEFFYSFFVASVAVLLIAFLTALPGIIFYIKNGINILFGRSHGGAVILGMSLSSIIMPITNHILNPLADLSNNFYKTYQFNLTEKGLFQIGTLASMGFLYMLYKAVFYAINHHGSSLKNNFDDQNKLNLIKFLVATNLLTFLFFCGEGFYMFVNYFMPVIRGIARLSICFVFLSLLFFGIYFDQIISQKKILNKIIFSKIVVAIIAIIALFDEVGKPNFYSANFAINQVKYKNYKSFIENVENSLPAQSKIFVMPVRGFPESYDDNYTGVIGYLFSKNLNFSYPMIKNRQSQKWQEEVERMSFKDMIKNLREKQFNSILIVKNNITQLEKERFKILENDLKNISKIKLQDNNNEFVIYNF
jgi:hypothetical protein